MNLEQIRLQEARRRTETMCLILLVTLNIARPAETQLGLLLSVTRGEYSDATSMEILRELDYLQGRDLITLRTDQLGTVYAKIDRYGIDIVGYAVECEPGIARPHPGV